MIDAMLRTNLIVVAFLAGARFPPSLRLLP
jgi:hypothetical protein